jgi:GTP-binding protein HflX
LPHSLVAAFRATLEEVAGADLLLHVIDGSSADRGRHMEAVATVLTEVGAQRVPIVEVFNKCDRLDAADRERLRALYPGALCVSALTGEGRDEVVAAMETRLGLDTSRISVRFAVNGDASRARVAELYRIGRILRHVASDTEVSIEAEIPRRLVPRFNDVRGEAQ